MLDYPSARRTCGELFFRGCLSALVAARAVAGWYLGVYTRSSTPVPTLFQALPGLHVLLALAPSCSHAGCPVGRTPPGTLRCGLDPLGDQGESTDGL